MSYSIIGKQIQKFRKAAGITQKELGAAIGISNQAVSQWEGGGTPDISLLPAIAERLGVTIDALFCREKVTPENMTETLIRYVASLPETKRINEICCLIWEILKSEGCLGQNAPLDIPQPDLCEGHLPDTDDRVLNRVSYVLDNGVILGVIANDMSFMSIFPEPEKGYDAYFTSSEKYRELFSTLSKPYAFELLMLLYRQIPKHYTAEAIAKHLSIGMEETEMLLSEFTELQLLSKLELEIDDGNINVYIVNDGGALIPFLYTARLMAEGYGYFHLSYNTRKTPLLKNIEYSK